VRVRQDGGMPWILLFAAIATEIVATVFLKASDGMSKLWPAVIVVVGYVASFALLAKALKDLEVGVAYAPGRRSARRRSPSWASGSSTSRRAWPRRSGSA
jgi:hypothetical protein